MLRVLLIFYVVVFLVPPVIAESAEQENPVVHFFQKGELAGQVGVAYNYLNNSEYPLPDVGAMWGLVELSYTTPSVYGVKTGGGVVGAAKIYEHHNDDFQTIFTENPDLKTLFLSYDFVETPNTLTAGRTQFQLSPATRGESHQGLQFVTDSTKPISFSASVINRWIHHSSTSFDADGITGWEDVSDINVQAASEFYSATLLVNLQDAFIAMPFVNHQDEVMTVYGAQLDYNHPLNEQWKLSLEGIFAVYANNVPESIHPDYSDVGSVRLHTAVSHNKNNIGVGWYYLSDDKGDINSGVFSAFDPLKEDDLFPYGDLNNCAVLYVDSHFESGAFSTNIAFGYGQNKAIDAYSQELDVWLYYSITEHLQLGGYLIVVNSDTKGLLDYNRMGTSLTYSF